MRYLKTLASALAVVMVLVMATDYVAMAATGKPIIMGKINKAKKTTTIKSAEGSALSLKTKAGQPPLRVNQKTLVANLNADLVDGKSANQFGVRTRVYRVDLASETRSYFVMTIPAVPVGTYLATIDGWIDAPAGAVHCFLRAPLLVDRPQDYVQSSTGFYAISASAVVTVKRTAALTVRCQGQPGTWSTYDGFQVSLTSIDAVQTLPATVARSAIAGKQTAANR